VPVPAWYMYGTTVDGLKQAARDHACSFANDQQRNLRQMLLDFGAPRLESGRVGNLDFSGHFFTESHVLDALEAAANKYHDCHTEGKYVDISYGSSNYNIGWTDAYKFGRHQAARADDLYKFERSHGYHSEGVTAASDMELSWAGPSGTARLRDGANANGNAIFFDYGDAAGCPTSGSGGACNNGWGVSDVEHVSYGGVSLPLPEIYYHVNARQWAVVRRHWNENHSSNYFFFGATATTGVGLTARQSWSALNANNWAVGHELVCFC
jgi:hypothetical protein